MESPVRIKSGAAVLVAVCIFLEICNGYPNQNVNELETSNEQNATDLETTTLFIRQQTKSNSTFRFIPRNSTIWKIQRKNSPNVTHYVTPTPSLVYNITTIKSNYSDSVVSTTPSGSKISFRGSVKYFTTRTPFKPKIPYLRRNITNLREDASEKISVNVTTTTKLPVLLKNKFKTTTRLPVLLKDTYKSTSVPVILKNKGKITTNKPIDTKRERQNSIESTTKHKSVNRSESSKSLDFSFNIDKYTSDEFHDINNVYSQSVSPEVEHFIVPENVSDYFVSVGSGSYVPPAENNYRTSNPSKSSTIPHIDFFDRRFKEVSDSIKQNLADADYANEDKSTAPETSEIDVGNVNFEELLSQPANNNTKLMYQNTKEIILNDSKNPSRTHMDFTGSNGTKIFYEMSMISTETYDVSSTTIRNAPTESEIAQQNEITTPSSSATNRIVKFASADNKVTRDEPSLIRRIDHFKTNGTRKEFLATIRMRAHTTPKPRIRISLKTNRNQQNTTVSGNKTEDASTTKPPEIVKMFPFTRRRTTLTTVASNIDPVLQETNSPSKFVDHTKSESDNTIPTLRKRGSVLLLDQDTKNSTKNESDLTSQFTIPPTAWALITLRDTPVFKKQILSNSSEPSVPLQADNVIKTEDDLQKLDKSSESNSVSSNTQPVSEKFATVSASKILLNPSDNISTASIEGKLNIQVTSPSNSISVSNEGFNRTRETLKPENREKEIVPDSEHSYSAFESITKLPSAITTPAYEEIPSSTSADFMSDDDYYGPTSVDASNNDSEEDFTIETVGTLTTERIDGNRHISSTINGNIESTTLQNIPLAELFTFPSDESRDDATTFLYTTTEVITTTNTVESPKDVKTSKSLTSTNVMDFDTMTSTLETFTSDSNTIIPLQNITPLNVDYSERVSTQYTDETTDDQVLSTLSITDSNSNEKIVLKNVYSTTMPYSGTEINTKATTTTDDDGLDDFSFSTFYSNVPTVLTSPTPSKQPTEFSNIFDTTATEIKNISQDIEAASTMYYGSTRANIDDITTTTFSHITNAGDTESSTIRTISNTESTTVSMTQASTENREAKHKIIIDAEDKTTNTINSSDQNPDDWVDTPDPNIDTKVLDGREIPNKINKTVPENESAEIDTEFNNSDNDVPTIVKNDNQPDLMTPQTNIEVIKSNMTEVLPDAAESLPGQTTTVFGEDEKFDTVDGTGAIAAITISTIGIVALLLLIGLLVVARGRRTAGGYGQRCTPVSLDSYSLDNVSVNGSTRRKARRASKRSYGNPAYDESGATSHPMQFAALANFSLDQESIVSEFNEIPVITVRADEVPPGCESKNRFSNVIPLPETRVFLKLLPGDETSDYINGNYVRGPKNLKNYYVACQAPMASTVNDFWRMIWEQNSRVILMLTEFMENGVEKCFEYIPPSEVSDNRRVFGDYKVTVKKREIRDKYIISQLQLKSLATRTWREVTHMWYFWPAKGVPDECHSIIAFLIEARSYLKASQNAKEFDEDGHDSLVTQNGSMATNQTQISMDPEDNNSNEDSEVNVYNVQRGEKTKNGVAKNGTLNYNDGSQKRGGPLVIHCSPGTGRTGAVIACDIGIRDFELARTVDVPKTVYRIRRDRANGVQTKDQYIFIYKVLSEYATKLTGGVLDSI